MKISQSKEARAIRRLLNDKSIDHKKLWWILTALRGPDDNSPTPKTVSLVQGEYQETSLKVAVTGLIRGRVGLLGNIKLPLWITHEDAEVNRILRVNLRTAFPLDHFYSHAIHAFDALNLKWDEVNK